MTSETPRHSVSVPGVVARPEDGKVLVIERADDGRRVPQAASWSWTKHRSSAWCGKYGKRLESRSSRFA